MRKPTGPAKIDTSLTPPGTPVQGVVALLFNFDFDDATVKPEHQAFLSEQFVPRLTAAPGLRVFLRGTASQVGNADYNLQLSRRRVEAVRAFLAGKGVGPGQIVTTFTGENLSTSPIADDERDRAVEAILEASTGPTRFERVIPVEQLDGFHGKGDPQGMVVGTPEISFVRLIGARGAVVESLTPGVVRVSNPLRPGATIVASSDDMLLQLLPGLPGPAEVVARLPGVAPAVLNRLAITDEDRRVPFPPPTPPDVARRLRVQNLLPRIVSLSFHYVTKGPPNENGVVTTRKPNPPLEQAVVAEMNRIYGEQTRIRFVLISSQEVQTSFAGPITVGGHSVLGSPTFTSGLDMSTRLRFLIVRKIAPSGGKNLKASSEGFPGRNILCREVEIPAGAFTPQDVKALGNLLAHECGHSFGVRKHPDPDPDHLMHEENTGEVIPADTAKLMNDHAVLRQ